MHADMRQTVVNPWPVRAPKFWLLQSQAIPDADVVILLPSPEITIKSISLPSRALPAACDRIVECALDESPFFRVELGSVSRFA